jgi:protein-S-isoprenylcysteine O-methyltransferase Ste14
MREKAGKLVLTFLMVMSVISLALLLGLGFVPDYINVVLWGRTLPTDIGCDVIIIAGFFLVTSARRSLGSNWNPGAAIEHGHELVKSGPYKYVRHPIYGGFLTMVLGTAVVYAHLVGVIILVTCVATLYAKAMREESLLRARFLDAYSEYAARIRLLIPFLL